MGPQDQGTLPVANLPTGTYSCTIVITDLTPISRSTLTFAEAVGPRPELQLSWYEGSWSRRTGRRSAPPTIMLLGFEPELTG